MLSLAQSSAQIENATKRRENDAIVGSVRTGHIAIQHRQFAARYSLALSFIPI